MGEQNQSAMAEHFKDGSTICAAPPVLLTRVPMPHRDDATPEDLARAQRAFPIVGALIGLSVGSSMYRC